MPLAKVLELSQGLKTNINSLLDFPSETAENILGTAS